MFLFPADSRRRQWYRREIVPVCFFHEEAQWLLHFGVLSSRSTFSDGRSLVGQRFGVPSPQKLLARTNGVTPSPRSTPHDKVLLRPTWKPAASLFQSRGTSLPKGTRVYIANLLLAAFILICWILQTGLQVGKLDAEPQDSAFPPAPSTLGLGCIYLSQLGLIYDNGVNALGRYIGEGPLLQVLSKGRFVWHVTSMPLLGIPVTELAARYGLFSKSMQEWIILLLCVWSLWEFGKWNVCCDANQLILVDVRTSPTNKGLRLSGTLGYTSVALWDMVLPPILLVCYEMFVGITLLARMQCPTDEYGMVMMTMMPDYDGTEKLPSLTIVLAASSPMENVMAERSMGEFHICNPLGSATLLSLCGTLTFVSSGMAFRRPELQLLGELLHGVLLWSAYVSTEHKQQPW